MLLYFLNQEIKRFMFLLKLENVGWGVFLTFSEYNQVSRSSSVPPNTRDALYQGLPPNIKSALRAKVQSFQVKEEVCD